MKNIVSSFKILDKPSLSLMMALLFGLLSINQTISDPISIPITKHKINKFAHLS